VFLVRSLRISCCKNEGTCVCHFLQKFSVKCVTEAISKVAGVNSVNVKLAEGVAEIESDSALDLQAVKDAVVAAGYSA